MPYIFDLEFDRQLDRMLARQTRKYAVVPPPKKKAKAFLSAMDARAKVWNRNRKNGKRGGRR